MIDVRQSNARCCVCACVCFLSVFPLAINYVRINAPGNGRLEFCVDVTLPHPNKAVVAAGRSCTFALLDLSRKHGYDS